MGIKSYLLVDVSATVDGELFAAAVEGDGVTVTIAKSESAGAKLAAQSSYDCFISTTPKSGSRRFLDRLRSQGDAPLIVLLSSDQQEIFNWATLSDDTYPLVYETSSVKEVASHVHSLVEERQLTHQISTHTTLSSRIVSILAAINSADSRDEIESIVCSQLGETDVFSSVWIDRYDETDDTLVPRTATGVSSHHLADRAGADIDLESVTTRSTTNETAKSITVTVPLRSDETAVGVLTGITDREIDTVDQETLTFLGAGVGAAIDSVTTTPTEQRTTLPPVKIFSRTLNHEINTHLQAIRSHLSHVPLDEQASDRIDTEFDRIDQLVTDAELLTRDMISDDERATVDLSEIIDEVQQRLPESADRITVTNSLSLNGHPSLLTLLVENLVRNSLDHAGSDATIRVGPLETGFFVEDTGCGIPSDQRASLFDWENEPSSTHGTGLPIVSRIADIHGWEIRVTESAEDGARFEILSAECEVKSTKSSDSRNRTSHDTICQ